MEDNVVYFDKDTPKIEQANKVRSLLAVNGDDETIGSVEFDLLVLEAGKHVGDTVKIDGLVLPTLGEGNKRTTVRGGSTGKTFTYGSTTIEVGANMVADLFWDGTAGEWSKVEEVEMPAAPPVTKESIQEFAYTKDEYVTQFLVDTAVAPTMRINGVDVVDELEKREWLKKLDQCFKGIKTFGVPQDKAVLLRQFTYTPETGVVSIGLTLVDDIQNMQDINVLPVAFLSENIPDLTKPFTLKFSQQYAEYAYFVTLDMTPFGADKLTFNFRDAQQLASYKTAGFKFSALTYLPKRDIWGTGFNFITAGAGNYSRYPRAFYFHEAVKYINVSAKEKALVSISSVSYNTVGNFLSVVIMTCPDNDPDNMALNTDRSGFAYLRINIPLSDTGVRQYNSFVHTGASTAEVKMVIDVDYLFDNVPNILEEGFNIQRVGELAQFIVSPSSSGGGGGGSVTSLNLIDSAEDFQGNFRFTSAGNWALLASSYMTKLIRIPDGATQIDVTASLDGGNSNIMYLDKDMKTLGWAYDGNDGVINVISLTPPAGARFVLMATPSNPANVRMVATGDMEISDTVKQYRSINEGLADKYSGLFFEVAGELFQKDLNGLCTLNEYKLVGGGWLESIPEYEKDGAFIIPTAVPHTNGSTFNGGTLCAVKDGVMYFYNARECAVFKSADGGATFETITDKYSHPDVWDTQDIANESRSMIHVLDNGELLIPIRMRGDIINPVINDNRYRYWTLWRTTGGQTDIEKCFEYSYESSPDRPWLPDTSPQRTWPNHSGGCPLGDFTQMSDGALIVVTEYGTGTSIYWNSQVPPVANNARGVSGRAWVSFDYGVTWKKMFDADRKKVGTAEEEDNWYYFTSTNAAKMRHMHGVGLDKVRGLVSLTNGDNEDYVWQVSVDALEAWYATAAAVDPNERPSYKTTDTYPTWETHNIVPAGANSFNAFSSMRAQMMQSTPVKMGHAWGHDASREFAYMSYENNGEFIFEPVFQFEQREDFDTEAEYVASWASTDGFVQQIHVHNGVTYFTHSNSATRPSRVWATMDGVNWKVVYEGDTDDIKFSGKILLDRNDAYLSNGTFGQDSRTAGYWKLKAK